MNYFVNFFELKIIEQPQQGYYMRRPSENRPNNFIKGRNVDKNSRKCHSLPKIKVTKRVLCITQFESSSS